jgi:hypothetical protein
MSDDSVQNYGNHRRFLPPWHFFALPILAINFIVEVVVAVRDPSLTTGWAAVVALALVLVVVFARWMPLRVQDRLISLEETLRLERLLPGRHGDLEKLTLDQLIGIRFASDAEVGHLVDRILAGEIGTRDEVKRAVQHWRSDHHRA